MESEKVEGFECFGQDVKKVEETEIEPLVKRNLLMSFFLPFCRVGLGLIFWAATNSDDVQKRGDKKGYTFDELCELINKRYTVSEDSKEILRKHLERALDILLDIGLFSAIWSKKGNCWERLFYNRNEVAKRLAPYGNYIKDRLDSIKLLQFLEMLLLGPNKNPLFFSEILKINAYLAHIGDIIDPDHWHINVKCESPIFYSTLWEVLKQISNNRIYDSNIKFYHERKKVSIYGLDEWIKEEISKLKEEYRGFKITQCKLRFLLEPEKAPEERDSHYDFPIKRFLVVPIVNFEVEDNGLETEEGEYPSVIDEILSELGQKLIDEFFNRFKNLLNNNFDFKFNAKCKLLQFKLENYENFESSFKKILSKYGKWESNLKMDLRHLDCWESFVPKTIRDKAKAMEKRFKQCLIEKVNECELNGNSNVLVTLARKGNILVKHLYEISPRDDDFVTTLKNFFKFNQNGKDNDFHSLSDTEFFIKIEKGNFKDETINHLIIFDDAVDDGKKLEDILEKIQDKKREEKIKIGNVDVIAFVANKNNSNSYEKLQQNFNINLKICCEV